MSSKRGEAHLVGAFEHGDERWAGWSPGTCTPPSARRSTVKDAPCIEVHQVDACSRRSAGSSPSRLAMPGPTCAVSPSMVCLPVKTRSTACSCVDLADGGGQCIRWWPACRHPAKARSVTRIASVAPKLMHLRSASSACGGPMHSMVTRPPKLVFEAQRFFQCKQVIRVDDGRHTLAHDGVGDRVHANLRRVRYLFDADDDVHGGLLGRMVQGQAARRPAAGAASKSSARLNRAAC